MTPLDDRDPVDVLAEDFADRLRRGEHPSVSDYAAQNPDHADQLRELLPAVAQMEYLKRFRRASNNTEQEQLPDRFGDFRIVRELGRGGMGVVFEAVQESLGRPVALKVLAAHAQLDDTRRERFVREAQAAAKLHHTNIVPVFGVGEQDGIPYYVMQLIRGEGLHSVVYRWRREHGKEAEHAGSTIEYGKGDTRPTHSVPEPNHDEKVGPRYGDWAFVASVGHQAADALHYAHKQGVLHRDVKPANLILDPAGRVWVADFGLAKLVNVHGLTATGDILGTLQYLAPECLLGDSDPRSDVYGLGATLYELLTLQPPYPMESPARLVKQMADADPIRPRQLNPDIPHDLETIVLKAMAREPHRRYVSPRELASDLQAFLEDRPIQARRETWASRAWRWCRRNPTVAILSVNVVAALVLAGIVGWVGYANTKHALEAEGLRRAEAEEARAEALKAKNDAVLASEKLEANLKLSLEAFERVFDAAGGTRQGFGMGLMIRPLGGTGGPGGRGGPQLMPGPGGGPGFGPGGGPPGPPGGPLGDAADKAAVLEAILAFYDKFAEQNATNPRLQLEAAKARRRVGEVQFWLGQTDKATESLRRAAASLESLNRNHPADENVRAELVRMYLSAPADVFGDKTRQHLEKALELARTFSPGPNGHLLGSVWLRLAMMREDAGDKPGAEAAYRAAIAGLSHSKELTELRPHPPVAFEQAIARDQLALLLTGMNRLPEARTVAEESVIDLRRFTNQFTSGPRPPRELLVMALFRLAEISDKLGDASAAEKAREEANRILNSFPGGPFGGPKKDGMKKDGLPPKKN